jgi:hypothetical protein
MLDLTNKFSRTTLQMSELARVYGSRSSAAADPLMTSGNYLDPARPGALGMEDHSRFRPHSFVAPHDVELMQGTATVPGVGNHGHPPPVASPHGWFMSR